MDGVLAGPVDAEEAVGTLSGLHIVVNGRPTLSGPRERQSLTPSPGYHAPYRPDKAFGRGRQEYEKYLDHARTGIGHGDYRAEIDKAIKEYSKP